MARNFYLRRQAEIVSGSANFASLIVANAALYGLTSSQSTGYQTLDSVLQAAYSAAVNPDTRTPVAIGAKDLAIRNVRDRAIVISKIIYATQTVNDYQLTALGLLPRGADAPAARHDPAGRGGDVGGRATGQGPHPRGVGSRGAKADRFGRRR